MGGAGREPPWPLMGPVAGETLVLRGREVELSPPTAAQAAEAKGEAHTLPQWQEAPVLCGNACVLARAILGPDGPLFSSGAEVLQALTPGEIQELSQRLAQLCARCDPPLDSRALPISEYLAALRRDSEGRLRWKVQRAFRTLPSEARVKGMRQRDYLYCALNLLLDQEEALDALCPSCRQKAEVRRCPCCGVELAPHGVGENPNFDMARFRALEKEGAEA